MEKISGIYKITNTITNDFYVGSSKNVKQRWAAHKWPSTWNRCSDNPMYLDMQKYGLDKFVFQILAEVEEEKLKEVEQQLIEKLQPAYNSNNAKGWDIEKRKEYHKEYNKTNKGKESHRKSSNKYNKSNKGKESKRKYNNQLCCYNGEALTLCALRDRFKRSGIINPTLEAKKYLL